MSEFIEPRRKAMTEEQGPIIRAGGVALDVAKVSVDFLREGVTHVAHVGSALTSIGVDLLRIDRR